MRAISFGLAAVVAATLFGMFGSVGATSLRASVDTQVVSMFAVLPNGDLVQVARAPADANDHASAILKL